MKSDRTSRPELYREGYDYYCTQLAMHPNAPGEYVFTSLCLQMAFSAFDQVETISPRPLLMIVGSKADTLYFSREAIEKAKCHLSCRVLRALSRELACRCLSS